MTTRRTIAEAGVLWVFLGGCGGKSLMLDGAASGGAANSGEAFVPAQPRADALAVDQERLYWVTGACGTCIVSEPGKPPKSADIARVRGCLKSDCDVDAIIDYDTWPRPGTEAKSSWAHPLMGLTVAGESLYWVRVTEADDEIEIVSCPVTGCQGTPRLVWHWKGSSNVIPALVSDGEKIYWPSSYSPAILSCSVSGCVDPDFLPVAEAPHALALHGSYVYWIANGMVQRKPKDGSAPTTDIVTGLNKPAALSTNSSYVSFTTNYSIGQVSFCPLEGCAGAPTALATNQAFPLSVASDEDHVYWVNASINGSARKASVMRSDFNRTIDELATIDVRDMQDPVYEHSVVVDEGYVYWISPGAIDANGHFSHSAIQRRAK